MHDFGIRRVSDHVRLFYRTRDTNACPGCGQSHWMVGRITAECAYCGTALPLHTGTTGQSALSNRPAPAQAPLAA